MKMNATILGSFLLLLGCGNDTAEVSLDELFSCSQINPTQLQCTDGSVIDLVAGPQGAAGADGQDGADGEDGPAGADGADGADGQDGEDAASLERVVVSGNSCTEVTPGISVEVINRAGVFDVYFNDKCKDKLGEYCDNVVPVESRTGALGPYNGSGTVCWADNYMISGVLLSNGDLEVYILDFN